MFEKQARAEIFDISKALFSCKMTEGSSVFYHVFKLHGYILRLEAMGVPVPTEQIIDLILSSLPPSFDGFVMDYNIHGMNNTLPKGERSLEEELPKVLSRKEEDWTNQLRSHGV